MNFENRQQRLNNLIASLTPEQKKYYSGRISKAKRILNIAQYESTLPVSNDEKTSINNQKKVNKKRKEELGDSLIDVEKLNNFANKARKGDLTGLVPPSHHNGHVFSSIFKSIKPNVSSVPESVRNKAIMARASTVFARHGKAQTEGYLSQMGLDNFEILPESNSEALVFRSGSSGKVKVAFRGTMIPAEMSEVPTGIGDVGTDVAVVAGYEDQTPQFKNADKLISELKLKYGNDVNELIGYSLGGAKAHVFGDKFGIDTTTFNPLVGKTQVGAGETSTKHSIYRTTEDIPSLGAGLINRDNTEVNTIFPLKSSPLNVKSHHDLNNWITQGKPRMTDSHLENLARESVTAGVKTANISLMNDMANQIELNEDARPPMPRFGQRSTPEQSAADAHR